MVVELIRKNRYALHSQVAEDEHILKQCVGIVKKDGYWSADKNIFNDLLLGIWPSFSQDTTEDLSNPILEDFQRADVSKMLSMPYPYILNRNKMGYGKTVETIEYMRLSGCKTILVVCPKSVVPQWKKELDKWWPEHPSSITVMNYEKLLSKKYFDWLSTYTWDIIVADEAHRIKNANAKTTRAIKSLKSLRRMALTGTPIMNKPDDLWSILHFLNPMYSGSSYWAFVEKFCEIDETFWGKQIVGVTRCKENLELLRKALEQVSVYNSGDIVVTQGKHWIDVPIEMTSSQNKLYKNVQNLVIEELQKEGVTVANGLSQIMKLQQVSSNPDLFECAGGNPKFDWILDTLQDNPELTMVVFSKFKETIKALNRLLMSKNIEYSTIHGDLSAVEREEEKDKFVGGETRVMTGTLGALSVGVDGLQHNCHTVVFIDKDYSPEVIRQAEDRVNRRGQTQVVNVYTLVCSKIDEKIGRSNIKKLEDIKELLE